MNDLISRIKPLVEEITFKSVEVDTPLFSSGFIDSIGIVDLAMMLEDEFMIKIDTRDIIEENFNTIECLNKYISGKFDE